ncbi:lipase member I-like [Aphidius gifuensis]|uniref:lipase member I-like n=1 Tax=Aphidius gifuensis TaxID=684658 RepID=UPI001CDD5CF2|nr:lipase member I-like [Aphidius gifuensis]
MRRSYLAVARVNYDVIVADWGEISKDLLYPVVVARLHNVADQISHYIEILEHTMSFDVDNLHIVGHSLGAHVAGFVGSHFHGTIRRITALDPAGPWFLSGVPDEYRIDRSDAKFVDVIHTCAGVAGLRMPCGHVDYYVNRGTCDQPGCLMPGMNIPCSHSRAYWLMIESIKYPKAFKVKFQYCNINGEVVYCCLCLDSMINILTMCHNNYCNN